LIGPDTRILSLQNGWGNGPRIAQIVGQGRVLLGVCYHSANVLGPGHVRHGGEGLTHVGVWEGSSGAGLDEIARVFNAASLETRIAPDILKEIWSKLALNVCTLPTSALLRLEANQLLQSQELVELMASLLRETVNVASASKIAIDYEERWDAITGLLGRCGPGAKSSMLQDVEGKRRTEIDVINSAIVRAGRTLKIATPYNESMVLLVKALEASFERK
jgi:2-dehydropantoate 2-reductase